ncbi:MAG TPA: heme exporter protein CcmD [Caulobacteraceae bacterium]|nr:heme exporter protein CcmD [Caulobacteraceae bacterium]
MIALGKYASYVIPAYAVSAVVIGALAADTLARARRWRAEVKRLQQLLGKDEAEL